jgi:hypothetical protein
VSICVELSCVLLLVRQSLSSLLLPHERRLPASPQRSLMFPVTESTIDTCYDCGRATADPHEYLACLWRSASGDAEHWGPVEVCPTCARQREQQRRRRLFLTCLFVAMVSAAVAYPILP